MAKVGATETMRTLPTGERSGARGFTLLELLVVLFILGVSISVLAPVVAKRAPGLQLKADTSLVAATLREARSFSIRDNTQVDVVVDVSARTLQPHYDADERKLENELGMSLLTATSEVQNTGRGTIRFFPDGTSTGGRIRLISETQANDVVVNWLTGYVEIRENIR